MTKKRYRVLLPEAWRSLPKRVQRLYRLSYPTDPEIIKRIQAGESIPYEERGLKEVPAGAVVDDLPAASVDWLLQQAYIEEVVNRDAQG